MFFPPNLTLASVYYPIKIILLLSVVMWIELNIYLIRSFAR